MNNNRGKKAIYHICNNENIVRQISNIIHNFCIECIITDDVEIVENIESIKMSVYDYINMIKENKYQRDLEKDQGEIIYIYGKRVIISPELEKGKFEIVYK